MAHAALAPGIGREFDPFLFASIGEGRHGHSLSVLSALAQSDFDPWLEAIALARMSRELAAARLSRLITALPDRPASARTADSIAGELVALLPPTQKYVPAQPTVQPVIEMSENLRFGLGVSAIAILVALSLVFSAHAPTAAPLSPSSPTAIENAAVSPSTNSGARHPETAKVTPSVDKPTTPGARP